MTTLCRVAKTKSLEQNFAYGSTDEIGAPDQGVGADWFAGAKERIESFLKLPDGWNGYTAAAPNPVAVNNALDLLDAMRIGDCPPTRIGPSAMGGIAITRKAEQRKVFIELYNDGRACALFSSRATGEMKVAAIDPFSLKEFVSQVHEYLND